MLEREPQSELEVCMIVNPDPGILAKIIALIEPVDEMIRPNSGHYPERLVETRVAKIVPPVQQIAKQPNIHICDAFALHFGWMPVGQAGDNSGDGLAVVGDA